jgi:hypothetical protein
MDMAGKDWQITLKLYDHSILLLIYAHNKFSPVNAGLS